eukprot:scaffold625_cov420-Prasinococcus_capsulatus_cf.AAC.13
MMLRLILKRFLEADRAQVPSSGEAQGRNRAWHRPVVSTPLCRAFLAGDGLAHAAGGFGNVR